MAQAIPAAGRIRGTHAGKDVPRAARGLLPDRRLTDRILEAFTHAYASGAREVAGTLLVALERAEACGCEGRAERRRGNARQQADRWVAFVDARDDYNRICGSATRDAAREEALARMKAAYLHWSEAVPEA